MRQDKEKTVIIGAGVIGLACAFRLSQAGYCPIVVDANAPGTGCSQGNAGHIATELVFPLASPQTVLGAPAMLLQPHATLAIRPGYGLRIAPWLARMVWAARPSAYGRGVKALTLLQANAMHDLKTLLGAASSLVGSEHPVSTRGNLLVAERANSIPALERLCAVSIDHGVRAKILGRRAITEMAPGLGREFAGGIYFPDTGHVSDPKHVCEILAEAIRKSGGEIIQARVSALRPGADGGYEIETHRDETDASTIRADRVIVAAGVGSASILEPLEGKIPLDTERGYALTYAGFRPGFRLPVASFERNIIMSPLACGLRITGGVEFGGVDAPPSKARIAALKHHAGEFSPAPKNEEVEVWMGRRPSLPDYLPAIGESERHRGLFYAFGHQHLGLTLSGVTATIMLALVEGAPMPMDIHPYRLSRF